MTGPFREIMLTPVTSSRQFMTWHQSVWRHQGARSEIGTQTERDYMTVSYPVAPRSLNTVSGPDQGIRRLAGAIDRSDGAGGDGACAVRACSLEMRLYA
eukprot:3593084-Rhodomonas_salina.1